jgi:GT2 family glycosyltransferase
MEYTSLCIFSVTRYTRLPAELVFLDFNSLDGTSDFLKGVAAGSSMPVRAIQVAGFSSEPPALALGLGQACGEFVVLLSNDTIVPDSWLNQLVALARSSADIGVVGPMSNHASPPQWSGKIDYRLNLQTETPRTIIETVDRHAKKWREMRRGEWSEVDRVSEICLLMKRPIVEEVLSLARSKGFVGSELGFQESGTISQAARRLGYRIACCHDLFVHNFGTRAAVKLQTKRH